MMNKNCLCKATYIFAALVFSFQFIVAQEMQMDELRQMPDAPKNIYLLMMDTMMLKMKMVPVTSVPDLDFMEQMIPHHQGAIAMAEYEIKNGKNREMIQLAKSISSEQANDIQIMKLLISRLPAHSKKAGKSFTDAMEKSMNNMMKNMLSASKLIDADKAFAFVMIPHHQAAIEMAVALIKEAASEQVATFAKQLISQEQIEIEQMSAFITK